jgi:hypothetical protein
MTESEQLAIKKALETLAKFPAGLPGDTLVEMVSIAISHPMTTVAGQMMLHTMLSHNWVYTYNNSITDQVRYAIADAGRVAMLGL